MFLGRTAPDSELRSVVCMGMLFVMIMLAILGLMEYRARRAGTAILISILLEIISGAGFASVLVGL